MGRISTQCENKALGIKLLDLAYKRIKYSFISSLLVSVLIVTALWPAVDRGKLAVWLLSMWLVVLMRNFIAQRYLNPGRGDTVEFGKWKSMLAIGAAASGVCWGVTVFFIPASSLDQATLLLIFVIAGVTAFASVSLATVPVAAITFLLSALLPLVVWLFSFGERIQFFMGVIALSYLGGMLLFSRQMYKLMLNSFLVTEQNRALTSVLQESDQRIAHYFESAPGFFYTVLKRSDGSYAMPFASAGIRDLFGLDPADVAHDMALLAAMAHPDDSEMTLRKIEQSAKNMTPYHVEYRIVHPQKGVRWMEAHLLPHPMSESGMRWDGFMHDITERKQMEKELHLREQMFRTLAENAPDPILRYDLTCRRIYSNAALSRISGISADALAGTFPEDAPTLPSDDNTKLIRSIRQVLETGKLVEDEINFVLRDGSIRIFHNRYAPEFGTDGAVISVLTFATDITEIKRLEGELCRQVEFQQTLLNALCDVGIQLMMIENGRIIHVGNREIARQFGYSDADLDAQPELVDFIHPDDRMRVMEYYLHRLKGDPVPDSYELGLITRAGERREYETAVAVVPGSDPVRVITVGKDITERKQMEEELAARERDFRSLAENIPDNVARWDVAGRNIYSNPVHQQTLGKTFAELVGKTHSEIFPDGRFASFDETLAQVVATGKEARILRVPVRTPDGGTDIHDVRLTPEFDAEGRVVSVLGLGRNMTEFYRMQETIAAREQELRALAESSPGMMGAFYCRPDGSVCMPYVSPMIEKLFGLQPQDVLDDASPLLAMNHPDDAQRVADTIAESARNMTIWHEEYRIVHPSLGERWMESNTRPELHPEGGVVWYGYIHDISKRKEIENVLHRSQESLAEAQRISKVGNWELDLVTNNLIWSNEIFRIFEIDPKQFGASYEAFLNVIHPDDRDAVNNAYTESLVSRAPYMIEHRLLMDDGRVKFVQEHCETHYSEDGIPLRSLGTVQDVTERKINENILSESFDRILELNTHLEESARNLEEQAVELEASQDQLKQTEEWYRSILHSAPDGMLVVDERGIIRQVNKQLVSMFGYSDGELMGSHIELLLPPALCESHAHMRSAFIAGGFVDRPMAGVMDNLRGCRKDGSTFFIDVSLSRLPDIDGRVGAICVSIRDITERKRMEAQVAEERATLRTFFGAMPALAWMKDVEGRYLVCNPLFEQLYGATEAEILGKTDFDFVDAELASFFRQKDKEAESAGKPCVNEEWVTFACDGRRALIETVKSPVIDATGKIVGIIGVANDITLRKRMEEALIVREREFRRQAQFQQSLLSGLRDAGTILVVVENGCFVYTNDHYVGCQLGYAEGQLPGTVNFIELIHPDDRPRIAEMHRDRLTGKPVPSSYEIGALGGDGSRREYEFHVTVVPDTDPPQTLLLTLRIDERKRQEDELRRREQEFRVLVENSPDVIVRYDRELRRTYINPAWERANGIAVAEALGKRPSELSAVVSASSEKFEEKLHQILESGKPEEIEIGGKNHSGNMKYFSLRVVPEFGKDGKAASLLTVANDITARKAMESELQESRSFLNKIIDSIPDPIFVKDKEHRWVLSNEAFCNLIGQPREQLIGKSDYDFLPKEQADVFWEKDELVFNSGETNLNEEVITDTHGETRYLHTKKTPFAATDGTGMLVGVIRDISDRKQAEDALRESQEKLGELFKLSPLGLALTDMQGRYVEFNEAFRAICGYPAEELMTLDYWTLTPKEYEAREAEQLESLAKTGRYGPYEKEYRKKDGTRTPIQLSGTLIAGHDGQQYIWSIVEDISERKRAEQRLQQAVAFSEGIINALPDILFEVDQEGRYLNVWTHNLELLAAQKELLLGNTVSEILSPDAAEIAMSSIREAAEKGLSFGKLMCIDLPHGLSWFELSVSKKSGDDSSGLRFLVLSRDVTTRKLAEDLLRVSIEKITGLNQHLEEIARNMEEQAVELEVSQDQLKQTEEWYRSILLSAPDGMLVFDERGVIRQVNKQLVTMFGYTDGELQGSHIEMLLLPAIREHHVHQRTDLFAGGIVASPMVGTMNNLRGCRKDGLEFPVDVSLSRLPDLDGRVGAICASIRDISERKAIETARENALAEAIRLAEMRSTFLSQMSHELRTPLNGILGFEQLLQMDSAINEGQRAKLHIIRESGEHLLALVNQILDYAKIEADKLELNLEDMQLDVFLDAVVGIIGVRAEQKKLAFVYEADGDLSGIVRGDELRLRQVLLNLLANAIKFTDSGEVSLRVSMPAPARIRFEVRDSGIGIAESQWEAIFQPFEQLGDASRIAQGTGLGLAISRKLVRLMGGDIKVESQPGAGSMFSFEIEMETVRSGEVKLNADALTKQAATSVTPMTPHIVAPPQQELDTMHGLALRGNMRDIMQHATRLAELDERYSPFSNYVCQLCKGFQTKALMSLIAQYRNEKEIE